jgi:ABC-2 type transport system permease protein
MSGKLLGTVAGSLTVFAIYVSGSYFLAGYNGWTERIPFHLAPWFIVFQVLGVLFYASLFLAIGASVSQLKEAQAMLLPVWMLMMSPMFVWIFLVRDPLGPMATYFSLFPPAAPTAMMLRMATGQSIPLWQPILGAILTLIATYFIVVLAARIFRVGILWQGKTPKLTEIIKWAFTG